MAIQIQAEAHELLPTKPKSKSDGRNDRRPQLSNEKRGGYGGVDSFATHDDKTSAESCPLGDEKHTVPKCENFTKMNPDDRAETAKEVNLCFSCLKSGHRSRECPSSRACGIDNYKKKAPQTAPPFETRLRQPRLFPTCGRNAAYSSQLPSPPPSGSCNPSRAGEKLREYLLSYPK